MALYKFTKSIDNGKPIEIYNNGQMKRSFTYIDDVIEGLYRVLYKTPKSDELFFEKDKNPSESWAPHKIFNIGNSESTSLMKYINEIENVIGKKAIKNYLPIQAGDVL